MKKFCTLILALITLITCFGAISCGKKEKSDKISVVCTVFPVYDWVKNLTKDSDEYSVELLMKDKTDMHSFQPSVADIATIAESDVFIYVGGESDKWVEKTLRNVGKDVKPLSLMQLLGDKARDEEHIGEDHDHDEEEHEKDEHIWLSAKNAAYLCGKLAEELKSLGKDATKISENSAAYCDKLAAVDSEYAAACKTAKYHTLVFGDRFPFLYLVKDYKLDYSAAFSGCSAETEASFETIISLAKKVDELGLPAIIKIDGSTHEIAETVKANTVNKNQKIIILNSMQSATLKDAESGVNYIDIMRENLAALKIALEAEI